MPGETWQAVWERKGARASKSRAFKSRYSADELFEASGYDTPLGRTSERTRLHMLRNIVSSLGMTPAITPGITPATRLLDVGCGSGAILSMLRSTGAHLTGVDFSSSLVDIARQHLADAEIRTAQATALPFPSDEFDAVLANGVFLYFPDFEYAHAALTEMLRVCRTPGRMYVTDIPDSVKEQSCRAERRAANASEFPTHLYYPKQFFRDFAAEHSLTVTITEQNISDYENNRFRFNVLFERSQTPLGG